MLGRPRQTLLVRALLCVAVATSLPILDVVAADLWNYSQFSSMIRSNSAAPFRACRTGSLVLRRCDHDRCRAQRRINRIWTADYGSGAKVRH